MSINFSNALYQNLLRQEGDDLFGLWLATLDDENNHTLPPEIATFEYRRDVFLWALERLLKEGRIKLAKMNGGEDLEGTPEELVELFRAAFPKSEADADRICTKPGFKAAYEGFGMNVWWFMDDCPSGVRWLLKQA